MIRFAIVAGAIFAGLSVVLGAFGAHALADIVSIERLATWQTSAKYLMLHGQSLIIIALLSHVFKKTLTWAIGLLFSGTSIFCFSLFLLVITNTSWLGAIAPIGGLLMICGWISLAFAFLKPKAFD